MTTATIFSNLTDDALAALPTNGNMTPEMWPIWAQETTIRMERVKAQVVAAETARTAPQQQKVGKPGSTRNGVPCLLWDAQPSKTHPNPQPKTQVDRYAAVLTLPSAKTETNTKSTNGKETTTTATTNFGPSVILWLPQSVREGSRGGTTITPDENDWYASGSDKTHDVKESRAWKILPLVTDHVECWIQETQPTATEPAKARKVTATEFRQIAEKAMSDFAAKAKQS